MKVVRRADSEPVGGGVLRRLFGQRAAVGAPRGQASVVAICSGKGGTGKSFVASNLAVLFHRRGQQTTLVDCDFGLGNAHLLLGLNPRLTLQHVLNGQVSVDDARCRTEHGPDLIPAGSGISRLADLGERELLALAHALEHLAAGDDLLLLDTAAGISPQSLLTLLLADHIVLVTNPEIAALTDAYALVKCLARQPSRPAIWVVVNRSPHAGFGRLTFDKLRTVARRFAGCELCYLGEVLEDPAVTQRRLGQPPITVSAPRSASSHSLNRIAAEMIRRGDGLGRRPTPPERALVQRLRSHLTRR